MTRKDWLQLSEEDQGRLQKVGSEIATHLLDADIRKTMNGVGGCKEYDLSDHPEEFHELIEDYVEGRILSATAIFLAMSAAVEKLTQEV